LASSRVARLPLASYLSLARVNTKFILPISTEPRALASGRSPSSPAKSQSPQFDLNHSPKPQSLAAPSPSPRGPPRITLVPGAAMLSRPPAIIEAHRSGPRTFPHSAARRAKNQKIKKCKTVPVPKTDISFDTFRRSRHPAETSGRPPLSSQPVQNDCFTASPAFAGRRTDLKRAQKVQDGPNPANGHFVRHFSPPTTPLRALRHRRTRCNVTASPNALASSAYFKTSFCSSAVGAVSSTSLSGSSTKATPESRTFFSSHVESMVWI